MLSVNVPCLFVRNMHLNNCFTCLLSTALNIDAGMPDDPRELLQRLSREFPLITASNSYTYAQEGKKIHV